MADSVGLSDSSRVQTRRLKAVAAHVNHATASNFRGGETAINKTRKASHRSEQTFIQVV